MTTTRRELLLGTGALAAVPGAAFAMQSEGAITPEQIFPDNRNVLFNRCRFQLTHDAVLPWTTNVTIFADCEMTQRAPDVAYPKGTFYRPQRHHRHVVLDGYRNAAS